MKHIRINQSRLWDALMDMAEKGLENLYALQQDALNGAN